MTGSGTLTGGERVVGRWVSLPALLVTLFWIGIWFLLPSRPAEWGRELPRSRMVVSAEPVAGGTGPSWHLAPDIFALPTRVGFSAPPVAIGLPEEPGGVGAGGTLMVQEEGPHAMLSAFQGTSAAEGGMLLEHGSFSVPLPVSPVLGSAGQKKARLIVSMDAKLQDDGMELPLFHEDAFQGGTEPFELVAFLQTDEAGKVAHVFVEKPCLQSAVNDWIVRQLYRAQARGARAATAGRVVVSWMK